MPKISIVIPIHDMKNGAFFLWRAVNSVMEQTFKDYEIIITKEGKMAENTNAGIKRAKGEFIKILYMDDWLDSPNYLSEVVTAFKEPSIDWLITSSTTNLIPRWTEDIVIGNNKLGSPSALTLRKENVLGGFDERMSWLLDCDYYARLHRMFGRPAILVSVSTGVGIHTGQMTNILTEEEKLAEHKLVNEKYA